jgi:hypothetical protein
MASQWTISRWWMCGFHDSGMGREPRLWSNNDSNESGTELQKGRKKTEDNGYLGMGSKSSIRWHGNQWRFNWKFKILGKQILEFNADVSAS